MSLLTMWNRLIPVQRPVIFHCSRKHGAFFSSLRFFEAINVASRAENFQQKRCQQTQAIQEGTTKSINRRRERPWKTEKGKRELISFFQNVPKPAVETPLPEPVSVGFSSEELYRRETSSGNGKYFFIETLGCQMNVADSEVVAAVLIGAGYRKTDSIDNADIVFLNTCAIRENAEEKALQRLRNLRSINRSKYENIRNTNTKSLDKTTATKIWHDERITVGVLGCMAERLKEKLLEETKLVDIVAGPDAYRDLPRLLDVATGGQQGINVQLSVEETYADITPVRTAGNEVSAFVSITRGCNNMCSYCIVPFTRGRERSRTAKSITEEVRTLAAEGFKEITLLGQNVNSYHDKTTATEDEDDSYRIAEGFSDLYRLRRGGGTRFADLLDIVASIDPEVRIRFTSPHPKDFTPDVLEVMAKHPNICKGIHLPAQSGSSDVLRLMRRGYTREAYLDLVNSIYKILPNAEISSDFISGFCGETNDDHQQTVSLMKEVGYVQAFMFAYSQREKTHAHRKLEDNVPNELKLERLQEVISTYRTVAEEIARKQIGKYHLVLVEGPSKKNENIWQGKTDGLRRCMFDPQPQLFIDQSSELEQLMNEPNDSMTNTKGLRPVQIGDYLVVKVTDATASTLYTDAVAITTLSTYAKLSRGDEK